MNAAELVGRAPEVLTPVERAALAGKWVALEIYTPQTLPERKIEAVGASTAECVRELARRGLDARRFEFLMLVPSW